MSDINVGMPPNEWEACERHFIHFHNFESLSNEKVHVVYSPKLKCDDKYEFCLKLYPGGVQNSDDGMMGLYLQNCSESDVSASFAFVIRGTDGVVIKELTQDKCDSLVRQAPADNTWGWPAFVRRATIIGPSSKALKHGCLTVEVRIKLHEQHCCMNFIPERTIAQNVLRSFLDEDTADVIFEVKEQGESSASVLFPAHKFVLKFCAEGLTLTGLCEHVDESTLVPIVGIEAQVFRAMLYHIYSCV